MAKQTNLKTLRSVFVRLTYSSKFPALLFLAILLGLTLFDPNLALANRDAACEGVGLTGGSCDGGATGPTVPSVIQLAIQLLSWLVGAASVIMIIIGGFKYVTSNGDANKIGSAKTTILYALGGLVVALLAQVLVVLVLDGLSG
jgi:hypothetical protein